jgi:hypothetical protein
MSVKYSDANASEEVGAETTMSSATATIAAETVLNSW